MDILSAYDRWAATYDSIDNPLVALSAAVLAERRAFFDGAAVLELGCGTARNGALALAAGARRYLGVDGSPGMLARARERFDDPRASFVRGDLTVEIGESFDLVLVCLVLEHVPDVAPVLAAAARAAPRLLALELHADLHAGGVSANFRIGGEEVRLPSHAHPAAELEAAARAAGFRDAFTRAHAPTPEALARSPKLARYAGRPALVELEARR
jgi:malonyl-CoA O-methyltransferase